MRVAKQPRRDRKSVPAVANRAWRLHPHPILRITLPARGRVSQTPSTPATADAPCRRAKADPVVAAGPLRAAGAAIAAPTIAGTAASGRRQTPRTAARRRESGRRRKAGSSTANGRRTRAPRRREGAGETGRQAEIQPRALQGSAEAAGRSRASRFPPGQAAGRRRPAGPSGRTRTGRQPTADRSRRSSQAQREERPVQVDPLSPFAKLAALRDQLRRSSRWRRAASASTNGCSSRAW